MQGNQSQTANLTSTQASLINQTITPDYTCIYAFCGTVFIISMITLVIIHKISEKWRIDNYKIKQLAIEKTGEQNILLLKKLNKVLEILTDGITNNN